MFVLEDLWNGKITPNERGFREGSEYAKLMTQATETADIFYKELSPVGKRAYDTLCGIENKLADIAECDSFIRGFRLGAGMILDVIEDRKLPMIQRNEMNTAE